jgi:hypothetical protein
VASQLSSPISEAHAVLDAAAGQGGSNVQAALTPPAEVAAVLSHATHLANDATLNQEVAQAEQTLTTLAEEVKGAVPQQNGGTDTHSAAPASQEVSDPSIPALKVDATTDTNAGVPHVADHPPVGVTLPTATPAAPALSAPAEPVVTLPQPAPEIIPAPVKAAVPPSSALALDQAELTIATSAVHQFLMEVPLAKTVVSQNALVVYDPLAADIDLVHLKAVTFDFSDGSHISLVGSPAELAYALAGHHH